MRTAAGMAAARAFRIGGDVVFMRGRSEGREALIIGIGRLNLFAIFD
jgi:hypothetical protein